MTEGGKERSHGGGQLPSSRDVAIAAARAAADKQATDIVILDVHATIVITDMFVICTASSQRQIKTVIEAIEDALKSLGERPVRREGEPKPAGGCWTSSMSSFTCSAKTSGCITTSSACGATPPGSNGSPRTRLLRPVRLPVRGASRHARAHSSAGRALGWQPRGQGFESPWVHFRRSDTISP